MALNLKGIGKALLDKLDRDKEREGFQIVPGGIRGGIQRVTSAPLSDYNFFANPVIKNRTERVKESFRTDPGQYSITRGFSNIVPLTKQALSPVKTFRGERPELDNSDSLKNNIAYGLRGATQVTPMQWVNALGIDKRGKANYQASTPQTEAQKKAQTIGRTLYSTALTAPIGGSNLLKNVTKRALTYGGVGGALGGAINKATGGSFTEGAKQGFISGVKSAPLLALTNPVTANLVGRVPQMGFLARQVAQRGVGAGANLIEDEILAKMDGYKRSNKDRVLSLAIGAVMTGNSEAYNKIKADLKKSGIKDADQLIKTVAERITPEDQFVLSFIDEKGEPSRIVMNKELARNWTGYLQSQGIEWKLNYIGKQGGFIQGDVGAPGANELGGKLKFEAPYKRGDIKTLETELDRILGTKEFQLSNKWQAKLKARETAMSQLEHYAKSGDEEAVKWFSKAKDLENQIINAQEARVAGKTGTKIKPEPEIKLDSALEELPVTKGTKIKDLKPEVLEQPKVAPETPPFVDDDRMDILGQFGRDPDLSTKPKADFEPTKDEVNRTILENIMEEPTGLKAYYNRIMNPIKNAPETVQKTMQKWRNNTLVARAKANDVAQAFTDIPEDQGWKVIQDMQAGKNTPETARLRAFYDGARKEGIENGLDINYLDNYLNQVWKETPDQIDAIIKQGAGQRPGFTKSRTIPSYSEGVKMGLTPMYTHPAQLAAHYRYQLDRAIANKQMADELIQSGFLLPGNKAPMDWKAIDSPLFPKSRMNTGDQVVIQDYKAPRNIANPINNIFEVREPGLANLGANISKGIQEFTLSAGVPRTPFNSFTLANLNKEVTSGRIRGPMVASITSLSDNSTKNYFNNNQKVIEDMAGEGIATFTNTDYSSMYKNMFDSNKGLLSSIKDKATSEFNKAFNEPTFKRFMPILQVEFYKDAYKNATESGLSEAEAKKVAAQATRNFYGITDSFSRSGQVEDTISTFVMAPRFREAMVEFWANNVKSLNPKTFKDPAFNANRKYLAGLMVTYGLYNLANKAITGRFMFENKDGKETSLEIPIGNGRSFYLPLAPTISTVPRRFVEAGGYLAGGDIAGATERMSSFASIPAQTLSSVLTNRTFYGGPIYQDDDSALTKLGKSAGYGFEQMAHPWIGEPMAIAQGRKTPFEALPALAEIPLYPSSSTDVAHLKGKQVTKFRELSKTNPAQAQIYTQSIREGNEKKETKRGVPQAQASGGMEANIPTSQEEFNTLYKQALSNGSGFREKYNKIMFDPSLSESEKQVKVQEMKDEMQPWAELLIKMQDGHPEKIFEAEISTYKTGGGASVEKRGAWVKSQIDKMESEEDLVKLIDRLWDEKVLTSGKSGVAQYILDNYGIDVTKYTSAGKISGSGSGKVKTFKVSTPTISSGTSSTWKRMQSNSGTRILDLSRPRGQGAGTRIAGLRPNIRV